MFRRPERSFTAIPSLDQPSAPRPNFHLRSERHCLLWPINRSPQRRQGAGSIRASLTSPCRTTRVFRRSTCKANFGMCGYPWPISPLYRAVADTAQRRLLKMRASLPALGRDSGPPDFAQHSLAASDHPSATSGSWAPWAGRQSRRPSWITPSPGSGGA